MPLQLKGRNLHGHQPNQYRLENALGRVVLTHNNIASHSAYSSLLNTRKYNDKNEARNLGEYIAQKVRNERNLGNAKLKFSSMVERILNHRESNQKRFQPEYLRAMETFRWRVEPLRAERRALSNIADKLQKRRGLTAEEKAQLRYANGRTKYLSALLKQEEDDYSRAVKRWTDHQDQIRYWKWVRNRVVPQVKLLLK